MQRRKFIRGLGGVVGIGALTGLYSWQIEPYWLEFVSRKMEISHLPQDLSGNTLMQISDIHVGNRFDWNYIIRSFEKAKKYQPDFVAYTGDYVCYESEEQFSQLSEVMSHAVRGRLGTVAILGNHDYGRDWSDILIADRIAKIIEEKGIKVLRNDQIRIQGVNFIGFDDYWSPRFDPERVMKTLNEDRANVVLCHNPDVADLPVWHNYQGWILSGHTHGGQCKPPFLPPPVIPVENEMYSAGEIDLRDGRRMYINRALGHLWPLRFNVRPEITVFELRSA